MNDIIINEFYLNTTNITIINKDYKIYLIIKLNEKNIIITILYYT